MGKEREVEEEEEEEQEEEEKEDGRFGRGRTKSKKILSTPLGNRRTERRREADDGGTRDDKGG